MINKGEYVKVVFKNSTQVEGIVETWSDKESILMAKDGTNKFIIFDTANNILGVKICYNVEDDKKNHQTFDKLVSEYSEIKEKASDDSLRYKKLADLKILINQQEKNIISEKLKEHSISEVRQTNYGIPNFIKKPSAQ